MNGKSKQIEKEMNYKDRELGDLFISYLNGHATEGERMEIEEHLQDCQECQEEIEFLEMIKESEKEKLTATNVMLKSLAQKGGSHI